MVKRPSLTAVMDKGAEHKVETPKPVAEAVTQSVTTQRKSGKKSQGWVQLNVYVPEELRTQVKIKALQQGRELSEVATELLEAWVAS